jgi:hypothetical protein
LSTNTVTLTVALAGTGTGAVSTCPADLICGPVCRATYATGSPVILTALPAAGSTFTGWSGGCSGTGPCELVLGASRTVTATFGLRALGPVAAWGFNDGGGGTAADASGNGNAGTLVNGPTWTAGRNGGALLFDGVDDRVRVSDSPSLDLTTSATFEAWVYPTGPLTGWRTILQKEVDAYFLHASSDTANRPATGGTLNGVCCTNVYGPALAVNTWTHLAATYDGVRMKLFINGVQATSKLASGPYQGNASPLWIGGNAIYGEHFKGKIDDIRVYNRALTAAEIKQDMAQPLP